MPMDLSVCAFSSPREASRLTIPAPFPEQIAATRGIPLSHSRAELMQAIARDEQAKRRAGAAPHRKESTRLDRHGAPAGPATDGADGATYPSSAAGDAMEDFNASDEEDTLGDPEGYLVGATSMVWEDELYTYGGLAPEGEFVDIILRWGGKDQSTELQARPANPDVGIPPGRYGHTSVVVDDKLYVFGGQGQVGFLDDLWCFDFEKCSWQRVDAAGEPPAARTGHCACVSNGVMFIFGGKDVRPGMDSIAHNDLYGYDLKEREWLSIETKWRRPAGGDGCAMTSMNGVLYVLSPSDTMMEMLLWCLQLSAQGRLRWTQVPRVGQLPTPRTDYVATQFGANWIVHGGRVLLQDGVLGDTYAFHFPTAEWGRFDPESDTDPRFGHAGSAVDGALVLLHGRRDAGDGNGSHKDAGVCVAINLEEWCMFPEHAPDAEDFDSSVFDPHAHALSAQDRIKAAAAAGGESPGKGALKAAAAGNEFDAAMTMFEAEGESNGKMNAKMLGRLNGKGYGQKGGLLGGSLHVGRKGSHARGDVELIAGNVKLHAHRDVLASASPGLAKLMDLRPVVGALRRRPDLVKYAAGAHPVFGQIFGLLVTFVHAVAVFLTFAARAAALTGGQARPATKLVFKDLSVPVLVGLLRWMYRIPLHPPKELLVDLHDAAVKYDVKAMPAYCTQRLKAEMSPELVAQAARIAKERHVSGLWKQAVRCANKEWDAVRYSSGMSELAAKHPDVAKELTLAVHDMITVPYESEE